jgi:hypothetical protein
VYQAVCSPIHNVLPERLRLGHRLVTSPFGHLLTRTAARLAGVRGPRIRWRVTNGPWFANMLAELAYDGRRARIRFDRCAPNGELRPAFDADLTAATAAQVAAFPGKSQ